MAASDLAAPYSRLGLSLGALCPVGTAGEPGSRTAAPAAVRAVGCTHVHCRQLIALGLLAELQKRIPDRWFFRRLLPATLFVLVAAIGGGQLGQHRWSDVRLARERIAGALQSGSGASETVALLVLVALAAAGCALAVHLLAAAVAILTSGAWPWWLAPLSRRTADWRARRWNGLRARALAARRDGDGNRADCLDTRRGRITVFDYVPTSPTWSGNRFAAAEARVKEQTGFDVAPEWTRLLLVLPDPARAALADARDAYDAACEAIAWSITCTVLGVWWWPAAPVGLAMWLAAGRWLRRAVDTLSETAEAVFIMHGAALDPESAQDSEVTDSSLGQCCRRRARDHG
ncbi:hypothetical protein [Streptomyces anulatus]|uniref:hypothetical protein n=1 Tax=Streptomyces anulatus TaxID=1892 RepID=UPI003866AD14|nr:hypothetical protein OHA54_32350 [Streptomyces anulatus]WTE06967.1 hypothetical protein OH765_32450 [Streptomyces anulatus]